MCYLKLAAGECGKCDFEMEEQDGLSKNTSEDFITMERNYK
jgi:7-cyano-7-deazaguanine synthase in queuosine biosynthesis